MATALHLRRVGTDLARGFLLRNNHPALQRRRFINSIIQAVAQRLCISSCIISLRPQVRHLLAQALGLLCLHLVRCLTLGQLRGQAVSQILDLTHFGHAKRVECTANCHHFRLKHGAGQSYGGGEGVSCCEAARTPAQHEHRNATTNTP